MTQTFTVYLDNTAGSFTETASELLAPYNLEDLPFKPSDHDETTVMNAQSRYSCWALENPLTRTLQR